MLCFAVGQNNRRLRMLQYFEMTYENFPVGSLERTDREVGQPPQTSLTPHQNDRTYFLDDFDLRSLGSVTLYPEEK